MPRKALERSNSLPYHVTARANNREAFHLPLERMWAIFGRECLLLTCLFEVRIHALVLMPNHFHLLMTVPKHDLGKVMNVLMSSVTRIANLNSGRSGHVFGGPYHWSLIKSSRYFCHALKYVYRNPVRAGLCGRVEDFGFSTFHGLIGQSPLAFPIWHTEVAMELSLPSIDPIEQIEWLNRPFPREAEELIRLGLRKKLFDAIIERRTRRASDLLECQI
jgi:putative transposase